MITYLLVVGFTIVGMPRPLGPRWRRFPRGPVGPDAARAEPLAVHRVDRRLGLGLLDERDERVALALERLGIADNPAIADLAEGREGLLEGLRLDLRRKVADKYVVMIAGVELGLIARAGRPVNLHLLVKEGALVHGGQRRGRALVVRELDEGVRVVAGLPDNLASLDGADLREERAQKVLGHRGVQVAHVQRTRIAFLAHVRSLRALATDAPPRRTHFHFPLASRTRSTVRLGFVRFARSLARFVSLARAPLPLSRSYPPRVTRNTASRGNHAIATRRLGSHRSRARPSATVRHPATYPGLADPLGFFFPLANDRQ